MDRKLSKIGVVVTTLYMVLVVLLVSWKASSLPEMPLNEIGDFLAGVFGPVAILWLILGFFQQGEELRQNNQALLLQAQELNNSVAQQRELVDVTRSQLAADMDMIKEAREEKRQSLMPQLKVDCEFLQIFSNGIQFRISCRNIGYSAEDVRLDVYNFDEVSRTQRSVALTTNESMYIDYLWTEGVSDVRVVITYSDGLRQQHTVKYLAAVIKSHEKAPIMKIDLAQHNVESV
ncbi:hypothetical protein [Pseudomonas tohonis]|uniref:hypothetical protein n=1 Tax=Pseudomonas tohonis TaxID=2725477 RepID=UPI0021DB1CDB|nr:hypothetical protein [Pseudomonas tohonis]UXY55354.1 hypothetical protein N9L84_12525 [Pseudomonas tohonis]